MDKEIKSFVRIDSYTRWMWLKKLSKLEFLAMVSQMMAFGEKWIGWLKMMHLNS